MDIFREKLEKSYELCYSCQRVLKKALNRDTNNVLGLKLAQIGAKGLQVLDRHAKKTVSKKRLIYNRICLAALIGLSVWNLYNTSGTVNFTKKHLDSYFPPVVTHVLLLAVSYMSAVRLLITEFLSTMNVFTVNFESLGFNITKDVNDFIKSTVASHRLNETDFLINSAAVLLSLKLVLENGLKRLGSTFVMLLWNVNMLWPKIAEGMMSDLPGDVFKVSANCLELFERENLMLLSVSHGMFIL